MLKFFDKEGCIKAALERAMGVLMPEDATCVFANVSNFEDALPHLESGEPVIFYGFESEASLRLDGNAAAPWFYSKNAVYLQAPLLLVDMIAMYQKMKDGAKTENQAVKLAARFGYKQRLVGILLHDIYPGKYNCEKGLENAKKEFGITGSIEEVRTALEKIRGKDVGQAYEVVGEDVIPGVFCDIEGTLLSNDRTTINPDVLATLKAHSDKAVTLWTGGDIKELEKVLYRLGVKEYPVVSKEIFRGCTVESIYDDLPQEEFQKQYGINCQMYNQVRN